MARSCAGLPTRFLGDSELGQAITNVPDGAGREAGFLKYGEIIRLIEQDGWVLKRTTGSHRHYAHPKKPGVVTVAGMRWVMTSRPARKTRS